MQPGSDRAQFLEHPIQFDLKTSKLGVETSGLRSLGLRKHPGLKSEHDNPLLRPSWRSRMTRRRASSAALMIRTREASNSDHACTFASALATSAAKSTRRASMSGGSRSCIE